MRLNVWKNIEAEKVSHFRVREQAMRQKKEITVNNQRLKTLRAGAIGLASLRDKVHGVAVLGDVSGKTEIAGTAHLDAPVCASQVDRLGRGGRDGARSQEADDQRYMSHFNRSILNGEIRLQPSADNGPTSNSFRLFPRRNYSTSRTSTATLSFCLGEPKMMPSIGETSEKSRPTPKIM